jgi:septal ring-binding cell division protein DamX
VATAPEPVRTQPLPVAAIAAAPAAAAPAAVQAPSRSLVEARLAAGKAMLDDPQGARYAIQLMVTDARERDYLQQYLRDAGRAVAPERLYAAPIGSPESPRISVLFGTYADRPEAIATLASLPEGLRQFRPYVRPIEAIRDEVRRAEGK